MPGEFSKNDFILTYVFSMAKAGSPQHPSDLVNAAADAWDTLKERTTVSSIIPARAIPNG
jgi:hypothetical protein